jgi:hypothetical protein
MTPMGKRCLAFTPMRFEFDERTSCCRQFAGKAPGRPSYNNKSKGVSFLGRRVVSSVRAYYL